MFARHVATDAACPVDALCRRFAAVFREWCATLEPGSLVPAVVVRRIEGYIDEHYAERLTRAVLMQVSGWDAVYLAETFRSVRGISIRSYVDAVRIEKAAARLRAGDKVESVIADVGWRGRRHFFTHFKMRMGMTPAKYRAAWLASARAAEHADRESVTGHQLPATGYPWRRLPVSGCR
jgi:AraC-like DNA-binding protein